MATPEFIVRDKINNSQSVGSQINNTESRDTGDTDSGFRFYDESTYSDEYNNLNDSVRENYDNMDRETRNRLERKILSSPDVYQYPSDLQNHPEEAELVHSVIFRILARTNSRVGQIAQRNGKSSEPITNTEENRVTGETGKEYLSTLGGIAAGIAGFKALTSPQSNIIGKTVVGGLVGGAAYAGTKLLVENVSTVRLNTAIELYVTQPPIAQYSAEWENKEIGALGGIVARGETPEFSKQGFLRGAVGLGELAVRGVIGAAASIPSALGLTGDLAAGIEATTRKVANPYKEQLFKSMGFRQFAFSYKFAPRNKSELEAVMEIIQQFKYHMHPENDSTNLFLEYPSEFEIEYRYRGSRNTYLSKISTCALTDMKITYGGQDAFTSFIDTQGAPSEINMELAFQELETLTNDRIGLDYKDSL